MKQAKAIQLQKNIFIVASVLSVPFLVMAILSVWESVGLLVVWKVLTKIGILAMIALFSVGILELVKDKK